MSKYWILKSLVFGYPVFQVPHFMLQYFLRDVLGGGKTAFDKTVFSREKSFGRGEAQTRRSASSSRQERPSPRLDPSSPSENEWWRLSEEFSTPYGSKSSGERDDDFVTPRNQVQATLKPGTPKP